MQHEIGDERLLERCREALDELRRQATDEADGVRDEVPLAVVLERPGRRIECLEQPVVDRRVRAGECVQERRLPDVRVAGESDRRDARPRALLSASRTLALERPESPLEERDPRARETAIGLELALTGAARADAATESLEVLPHAAHPRQVVLELGQLDLELALGAPRVLGEDVEDQLRAIDDASAERVLERSLLRRAELVVGEQHLGGRAGVRLLQLRELPLAHERARIRVRAMLDDLVDGSDACRAREIAELGELEPCRPSPSGTRPRGARAPAPPLVRDRAGARVTARLCRGTLLR